MVRVRDRRYLHRLMWYLFEFWRILFLPMMDPMSSLRSNSLSQHQIRIQQRGLRGQGWFRIWLSSWFHQCTFRRPFCRLQWQQRLVVMRQPIRVELSFMRQHQSIRDLKRFLMWVLCSFHLFQYKHIDLQCPLGGLRCNWKHRPLIHHCNPYFRMKLSNQPIVVQRMG